MKSVNFNIKFVMYLLLLLSFIVSCCNNIVVDTKCKYTIPEDGNGAISPDYSIEYFAIKDSNLYYFSYNKGAYIKYNIKSKERETLISINDFNNMIINKDNLRSNRKIINIELLKVIDKDKFIFVYAFSLKNNDTIPYTNRYDACIFDKSNLSISHLVFPDEFQYIGFSNYIRLSYIDKINYNIFGITTGDYRQILKGTNKEYIYFTSYQKEEKTILSDSNLIFSSLNNRIKIKAKSPLQSFNSYFIFNSNVQLIDSDILGLTQYYDFSPNEKYFAVHYKHDDSQMFINIYNTNDFSLYKKIDLLCDYGMYTFNGPTLKFLDNETIVTSAIKIPTLLQDLWFINIKTGIITKVLENPYY